MNQLIIFAIALFATINAKSLPIILNPDTQQGVTMGGIKLVTKESDPVIWYRARDIAVMIKESVVSTINQNGFSLSSDLTEYPFELVALGVQVMYSSYI